MKIINKVVVLLVFLVMSSASYAFLLDNSTTMPDSGIKIADDPIDQPGLQGFCNIESVVEDYYEVSDLASLGDDGQMLQDEIYKIYDQIINAMFITQDLEIGGVRVLDPEANQAYGYEAARSLSLRYNFITEGGQEYVKGVTFRYDLVDGNIKPILFSISEAEIDIMNPPSSYYFFEEDSVRFEEIF